MTGTISAVNAEGHARQLWQTASTVQYQQKVDFDLDVSGVQMLRLHVGDAGQNSYDHADWIGMQLTCQQPAASEPGDGAEPADPTSPGAPSGPTKPGNPVEPGQGAGEWFVPRVAVAPWAGAGMFFDVGTGTPFASEIGWMGRERISLGYGDGRFGPFRPVDREAVIAFLYRLAGSPQAPQGQPFTDVPVWNLHRDAIAWGRAEGVTTGWPDGSFHPGEPVTREAFVAFVHRFCTKYPQHCADNLVKVLPIQNLFRDAVGTPFALDIAWAANAKVTTGWEDGTFRPAEYISRAAVAAMLYRATHNQVQQR